MSNVIPIDRPGARGWEGRTPPHDLDAEAAVLSAILIEPSSLPRVEFLTPEHFYSEAHRRIYEAILHVARTGGTVDITTVMSRLKETERLKQVGGAGYVTELLNASPAIAHIHDHAKIVHDRARARAIANLAQRVMAEAFTNYEDPQRIADVAVAKMSALSKERVDGREESNIDGLRRLIKDIQQRAKERLEAPDNDPRVKRYGLPIGIAGWDDRTYGLHATKKITIVAPNGVGKTSLALQILITNARHGVGSVFFSLEMTRDEILIKILSYVAKVDSQRLNVGMLSAAEWSRVTASIDEAGALPIHIVEDARLHVGQVRSLLLAAIHRAEAEKRSPIGLYALDYIQRISPHPDVARREKHEYLYHASHALKELSKETRLPCIELAQRRGAEYEKAGKDKVLPRPREDEVADCRGIVKESNEVYFLWRPGKLAPDGRSQIPDHSRVVVINTKNRGGVAGWELELDVFPEVGLYVDPQDRSVAASRDFVDQEPLPDDK